MTTLTPELAAHLRADTVISAPLALTAELRLDERRQAALSRYYCAAGAGGLAVGVHTHTVRDPRPGGRPAIVVLLRNPWFVPDILLMQR